MTSQNTVLLSAGGGFAKAQRIGRVEGRQEGLI